MYVYTSSKLHRRGTDERVACIFAVTPHMSRRFLPLAVLFRLFACLYLQQVVRFLAAAASRVKPILHYVYTRMNRRASYRAPGLFELRNLDVLFRFDFVMRHKFHVRTRSHHQKLAERNKILNLILALILLFFSISTIKTFSKHNSNKIYLYIFFFYFVISIGNF